MSDNIILIGYRGTGKTSVGRQIAEKTNRELVSTDKLIVEQVGPIPEFVDKKGWNEFRKVETNIIADLDRQNAVIDCGGGVIEREENLSHLQKLGPIFWLTAQVPTIAHRIKDSTNRPSLTNDDFVSEISSVLERRNPLYKKFADYKVSTDNKNINEIAQEIINKIE